MHDFSLVCPTMKNISYISNPKMSPWRKVSLASWKPTGDSSTYCLEDVLIDNLLSYCQTKEISINSFFVKAISNTIANHPKINSTVRWGKIFQREDISVFFHTIISAQADDLSGIVIKRAHQKPLIEVNQEFIEKATLAKNGVNDYVESKAIINKLPQYLVKPMLRLYSFLTYTLNWNSRLFKSQPDAYGSVMLTSVGGIGISNALCPISPYTRVPMVISMGKIEPKPVVVNGAVEVRNVITLGFTFDHRIMDGIHFSEFFFCLKGYLLNPESLEI